MIASRLGKENIRADYQRRLPEYRLAKGNIQEAPQGEISTLPRIWSQDLFHPTGLMVGGISGRNARSGSRG